MKGFNKLFHFLGGLYLALFLLSTAAIAVIWGTFLEAKYDSHLQAAASIYSHPFFSLLLAGFFINILFSALRRWPFKKKHIPFLITHLGLLMVIGGTIVKNKYGIQGNMAILEGSASQHLIFPHTLGLMVESKTGQPLMIPIDKTRAGPYRHPQLTETSFRLVSFTPHVNEKWESWIKGPWAVLVNFLPFPVQEWDAQSPLEVSRQAGWDLVAVRTNSIEKTVKEAFAARTERPRLLLVENDKDEVHLFAVDPQGKAHTETFTPSKLGTLMMYDKGFGGYTVQAELPFTVGMPQGILKEENLTTQLEAPLSRVHKAENPLPKMESNRPGIILEVKKGSLRQQLSLAYESGTGGLKWPILNGEGLIRFQPRFQEIPYRVRLRQARQINYANSTQPFSYESDIIVSRMGEKPIDVTLSMNRVYETWDGYRFYLAGMSSNANEIKRVNLVVNYDPAKYWLTYPGAILVALGILLLFWWNPYFKK